MRRKGKYGRSTRSDGGSSWISYSDMMAALLLLFVLVLCYSMYQYFTMLESKTSQLDEQAALLSAQQITVDSQKETLDEQTRELAEKQRQLDLQESELTSSRILLSEQQGLLDKQTIILADQKAQNEATQIALGEKETELAAAYLQLQAQQTELDEARQELDAASIRLTTQQDLLNAQQAKLDDLVGVRTKIVQDLTAALRAAKINAQVDPNTGDIILESAVFFEFGQNEISQAGKVFLQKFIPVYLGVLLREDYRDYLGEIIVEGHTDSSGDYLMNLKLSQERALNVTTYCLNMDQLKGEQRELFIGLVTATGKSFSNPVLNEDGTENAEASRRVEFKFRLRDAEMIDEIRQILDEGE